MGKPYRLTFELHSTGRFCWRIYDTSFNNMMAGDTGSGYRDRCDMLNCAAVALGVDRLAKIMADEHGQFDFEDKTVAVG